MTCRKPLIQKQSQINKQLLCVRTSLDPPPLGSKYEIYHLKGSFCIVLCDSLNLGMF